MDMEISALRRRPGGYVTADERRGEGVEARCRERGRRRTAEISAPRGPPRGCGRRRGDITTDEWREGVSAARRRRRHCGRTRRSSPSADRRREREAGRRSGRPPRRTRGRGITSLLRPQGRPGDQRPAQTATQVCRHGRAAGRRSGGPLLRTRLLHDHGDQRPAQTTAGEQTVAGGHQGMSSRTRPPGEGK